MKLAMKLMALFICVLMLANFANAESPREQLKQMVEQLQQSPTDNALREKVIKLAQTIKPAPAVPDEAIKYEGRGQFRFKQAKSEQDYVDAAKEYEQAVQSAPWVSGYYSDLCTIYEKAGKFAEAKLNCEFALLSISDPSLITEIKRRIAGLEVGIETSSPAAMAERKRKEDEKTYQTYIGRLYSCNEWPWHVDGNGNEFQQLVTIEVRQDGFYQNTLKRGRNTDWKTDNSANEIQPYLGNLSGRRTSHQFTGRTAYCEIAKDGSRVICGNVYGGTGRDEIWITCYPK